MVRTTTRRHWIPGRQTLTRNEFADTVRQAEAPVREEGQSDNDATFDRNYGWLDLHRNELGSHNADLPS
jgi:hypothetical protein